VKLTTFHQITIGGATLLAAGFALRSLWLVSRGAGSSHLWVGLVSLALALAAGLYLRRFRARLRAPAPSAGSER
jgi:hypothetical protein